MANDSVKMEWRSIDDAPSNGEWIIVCGGNYKEPTVVMADGEWWRIWREAGQVPSVWMPLPPMPEKL